tara:strand:+ start:565 stop:1593 length:1029 start_codon:yes stop_codon:yes gene_type:complete
MADVTQDKEQSKALFGVVRRAFLNLGALPLVLIAVIVFFGVQEERFLSADNIFNVVRQSTYLAIIAMGQMLVLLTAGLDLSVGSLIGLVSVVAAQVMAPYADGSPDLIVWGCVLGVLAGLGVGVLVGVVNGVGVAFLNVPPFMMTLGMLSSLFGAALLLSGGSPVYGLPEVFSMYFGFGRFFDIPAPLYFTVALFVLVYVVLNWTRLGRYFYAIGSNRRAARLSGVRVKFYTLMAYVMCSLLVAVAGLLLLARIDTGEATLGQSLVLESVAACAIGGVSLFGGIGRVGNVLFGAFFITLLTNGMNLIRVESYVQQIVLGLVLIFAIVVDQFRLRYMGQLRTE